LVMGAHRFKNYTHTHTLTHTRNLNEIREQFMDDRMHHSGWYIVVHGQPMHPKKGTCTPSTCAASKRSLRAGPNHQKQNLITQRPTQHEDTPIIRQHRLRWLGHVRRMDDGRIPKDALYGEQEANAQPVAHCCTTLTSKRLKGKFRRKAWNVSYANGRLPPHVTQVCPLRPQRGTRPGRGQFALCHSMRRFSSFAESIANQPTSTSLTCFLFRPVDATVQVRSFAVSPAPQLRVSSACTVPGLCSPVFVSDSGHFNSGLRPFLLTSFLAACHLCL
jgi:hypothetical protein